MAELVLTRGYPASGKSTFAMEWLKEDPDKRFRFNRDDLRATIGAEGIASYPQETNISVVEKAGIEALLQKGVSVIVDATNLKMKFARAFADIAVTQGASFRVIDFDTPLEECLRRNKARAEAGGRFVPERAIISTAKKFPLKSWVGKEVTPTNEVPPVQKYVPDVTKRPAWIVDIDGTIALNNAGRNPYDYDRVHEDDVCVSLRQILWLLDQHGHFLIVVSGRDDSCQEETEQWLIENGVPYDFIYMRKTGDKRKDSIVKAEIFDEHIRQEFNVMGVFDDRLQVARMWHAMGLRLFRLGDPDANF